MVASAPFRKHGPSAFTLTRAPGHWTGRFAAMACPCEVLIEPVDEDLARQIVSAVARCAWRIEAKFSRYRQDSVVAAINTSGGKRVEVDEETANLLDFAATLTRVSGGRFDLTSGVLRRAWTFDGGSHVPTQEQIDTLMQRVGWSKVRWERPWLYLPAGMELDFGGVGKEYAVDIAVEAADTLAQGLSCLVNFGGDVAVRNIRADGGSWNVGIETIQQAGDAADIARLPRGALATSGDTRRFVLCGSQRYSHIIDARTGWPVRDAPRSVTVAASTCSEAGSISTLAMLEGAGARRFLESTGHRFWLQ